MQIFGALRRMALASFAIRVLLAPPVFAQSFEERHVRDLAMNPADLHFRLSTRNGQPQFHIGERISISLEFSSDSPEKYKLNGATYDRSGRLPTEEFVLDGKDVADPYLDYFGTAVLGGIAGGLRSHPILESAPYIIELDLNDWFRFDRSGRYQFYLKSHRLTRERIAGETGERTVQFAVTSNLIEIEILPQDRIWESAKLAEIRAVLDQLPKADDTPASDGAPEEKITIARRDLRYLGTPGAVRLSLELARNTGCLPDTLLLVGARDRSQVIAAFEDYLSDPHVGIQEWDIRVRALFRMLQDDAPEPLPMFPWQFPNTPEIEKLWTTREARQARFEEIVREQAIQLIPAAVRKDEVARKTSAEAIAAVAPGAAKAARLIPPDDYGLSREQLIAQFSGFPAEQQVALLGKKWDLVRGPEMIPVLCGLVDKEEAKPLPDDAQALNVLGTEDSTAGTALRRLTELSPQEAARVLRNDIASGKPRFARFAVREFPAQDIPNADHAFSVLLNTDFRGVLPLVAKFGTVRLADQMRKHYDGADLPCAEEEWFVTYFVRLPPGGGPSEGRDALKRAMADRELRGCYQWLLTRVANVVWNATVEAEAIAALDDSDSEVARRAVQLVAAHGGIGVEPLLWKRLERWSEHWRGRTEELEVHPITGSAPNEESQLGSALFEAIASARSWLLDESRRKRLLGLCVDDYCKDRWSRQQPSGTIRIEAASGGPMYPTAFSVEGYEVASLEELKRKLQQYPAGAAFRWCPQAYNPFDAFSPGQRDDMFKELAAFLADRSMGIEPYSEGKCLQ